MVEGIGFLPFGPWSPMEMPYLRLSYGVHAVPAAHCSSNHFKYPSLPWIGDQWTLGNSSSTIFLQLRTLGKKWGPNHWSYLTYLPLCIFFSFLLQEETGARSFFVEFEESPMRQNRSLLLLRPHRQGAVFTVKLSWEAWAQATRRLETSSSFWREIGRNINTSAVLAECQKTIWKESSTSIKIDYAEHNLYGLDWTEPNTTWFT